MVDLTGLCFHRVCLCVCVSVRVCVCVCVRAKQRGHVNHLQAYADLTGALRRGASMDSKSLGMAFHDMLGARRLATRRGGSPSTTRQTRRDLDENASSTS